MCVSKTIDKKTGYRISLSGPASVGDMEAFLAQRPPQERQGRVLWTRGPGAAGSRKV